jgi:peptidoglycan/LPS O-acetylase OafA/YrhL
MTAVSLLPILPIVLLALATMRFAGPVVGIILPKGHAASIDGFRGYLAFFVFLHHSVIWYYFLRFHQWGFPPSRIYSHLEPTSVAFFFMITGFLFFSKLLDARGGTIDWVKLYIARVFRILPLYLVVVFTLFLIVAFLSGFVLHEPVVDIASQLIQWVAFMEPDVNGIGGTRLIVAGVVWSLAFEWLFYFALVFIAFFLKIKTPVTIVLFAGMFLVLFGMVIYSFYPYLILERLSPFLGGIATAFVVRNQKIRKLAVSRMASVVIALLLCVVVTEFESVYEFLTLLCLSFVFAGIACGNTLFGVLTHKTSRLLGQVSYSIYLLHGLLLFVTFRFILGFPAASRLSPTVHWVVIAICGILLVILCSFTYYCIELPFINAASGVAKRLSVGLGNKRPETSKAA